MVTVRDASVPIALTVPEGLATKKTRPSGATATAVGRWNDAAVRAGPSFSSPPCETASVLTARVSTSSTRMAAFEASAITMCVLSSQAIPIGIPKRAAAPMPSAFPAAMNAPATVLTVRLASFPIFRMTQLCVSAT